MLLGVTLQVHCIMIKITRKVTPLDPSQPPVCPASKFSDQIPLKANATVTACFRPPSTKKELPPTPPP
jgi:hypothetical protein